MTALGGHCCRRVAAPRATNEVQRGQQLWLQGGIGGRGERGRGALHGKVMAHILGDGEAEDLTPALGRGDL